MVINHTQAFTKAVLSSYSSGETGTLRNNTHRPAVDDARPVNAGDDT